MIEPRRPVGVKSDRLRVRAIDFLAAGPGALLPLLGAVALASGLAGLGLLASEAGTGHNVAARWCLRGIAAAGLLALVAGIWTARRALTDTRADGQGESGARDLVSAAMLAAMVITPALLLPVHYLAARTHPTTLQWNHFGFMDKRWLTSLFLIATLGTTLALAVAWRLVAGALGRAPAPAVLSGPVARRRGSAALKVLAAVVVAAYFFGPPWHLPAAPIDYHEALTMGGVQAVRSGATPYLDSAAVQYGPGAQVADVAYVAATGHVSVDGFRDASLLFHWVAATIFLCALFLRVRPLVAAVTTVAAVTMFPTLQTFVPSGDGRIYGYFWGWTNTLRYAGVFMLAMAFPAVVARARAAPIRLRGLALGAAWGLLCLVAQENLIGGVLVVGALSVLFVATATYGRRAVLETLGWLAGGLALVAVPVLVYYAAHGALARFLELYTLVPRAVASGYSNTAFPHSPLSALFDWLPYLLGALLLASLLRGRPLGLATQWTRTRVVVVSALLAAVVCHLGALTRSDAPHLINTELALPAAICLAAIHLPGLLGLRSRRSQWAAGLAIAAAAVAILPLSSRYSQPQQIAQKIYRPLHARFATPPATRVPAGIPARSIAAARIGPTTLRQRICCTDPHVPMTRFVAFMDRLHALVGRRRVLVEDTPVVTAPAVYFLAGLRPAPFLQDSGTMVLNNRIRTKWLRFFDAHLDQTHALVTTSLAHTTARRWSAAFPRHRTSTLRIASGRVYVLVR